MGYQGNGLFAQYIQEKVWNLKKNYNLINIHLPQVHDTIKKYTNI